MSATAWRTSSSLNGLMMAVISFIVGYSVVTREEFRRGRHSARGEVHLLCHDKVTDFADAASAAHF